MSDARPDPDQLLAQIHSDEARAARGRLRIYFGSSAGVGKTYAMLVAARALRAAGIDVVAGVVETHGRVETAASDMSFSSIDLFNLAGVWRLDRLQIGHAATPVSRTHRVPAPSIEPQCNNVAGIQQ